MQCIQISYLKNMSSPNARFRILTDSFKKVLWLATRRKMLSQYFTVRPEICWVYIVHYVDKQFYPRTSKKANFFLLIGDSSNIKQLRHRDLLKTIESTGFLTKRVQDTIYGTGFHCWVSLVEWGSFSKSSTKSQINLN